MRTCHSPSPTASVRDLVRRPHTLAARFLCALAAATLIASPPAPARQPDSPRADAPQTAAEPNQPGIVERFDQTTSPAGPATAPPLTPPAPEAALRAFNAVRRWINNWEVDTAAPPVAAACITLHLDAEVLARAEAIAPPNSDGRGVIESAAQAALAQADERIAGPRDALWPERRRQIAASITFTLELAGAPFPIDVASFRDAALSVSPGMAGVGARVGAADAARTELVFPLTMLATGLDAGAALSTAAAALLEDGQAGLADAPALTQRGVRFLAFDCVAVAELGQDRAVAILHRGGRIVETRDVTSPMLRDLGASLADALVAMHADDNAQRADALEDALAAFALARWASTPYAGSDEQAADWRREAATLLDRSGQAILDSNANVATAAVWLMAESEWAAPASSQPPGAPDALPHADRAVVRGLASQAVVAALTNPAQSPPPVAVMAAWAGARRAAAIGDIPLLERADAALRSALARTPPGDWVGLLPWAGWAEHELAHARAHLAIGDPAIPAAAALRELRTLVWRHQIGASDVAPSDRDLVGGIVFTRARQPLPTWHSMRPLAYIATMLADPALTPEQEYYGQVIRLLASLRFLRQLCADEGVLSWADGAQPWGVRAALWTDDQPPEATSMGLLVIAETLRSLEAVQQRPTP
ncbi:MAG: hypothetical protein H6809_08135 [Phycisphaeraceae bacterium]|nr:hypothetical protein [Phycisphaeraceae bacterium]